MRRSVSGLKLRVEKFQRSLERQLRGVFVVLFTVGAIESVVGALIDMDITVGPTGPNLFDQLRRNPTSERGVRVTRRRRVAPGHTERGDDTRRCRPHPTTPNITITATTSPATITTAANTIPAVTTNGRGPASYVGRSPSI